MRIASVFLEAIATILSFSALQSALFCLAFYFADVKSVTPDLYFCQRWFITQSLGVSLGEGRGNLGERRKIVAGCVLFSWPSYHFLKVETSNCNFVVFIILLNPWLIRLVFYTELSGFSFFLDRKVHWQTYIL